MAINDDVNNNTTTINATSGKEEDEHYFEELEWLKPYTPCFRIDAANISVLKEPDEFYRLLLVNTIERSLKENHELRGKVLFDYSRGLRGAKNSKTMLLPLVREYDHRFFLFLYHTPKLRGMVKKILPERTNETIGVMHMKIYIADNDLVISGANLSHDYFTNRQDRYIHIRNCERLCDFFESIMDSLGQFSFQTRPGGECVYLNDNNAEHPFNGHIEDFSKALSERLNGIMTRHQKQAEEEQQQKRGGKDDDEINKAFIYPLIQINDCSIRLEEMVTEKLFKCAPMSSSLYLAVGYFNMTNNYIDFIVKHSAANFRILLSSPEANGFFGAAGFSSNIPRIYSYLEEEFYNQVIAFKQDKRISLHEYKRDKWSMSFSFRLDYDRFI